MDDFNILFENPIFVYTCMCVCVCTCVYRFLYTYGTCVTFCVVCEFTVYNVHV